MARKKNKSFMTAATMGRLPLMAGGVLLEQAGRASRWAFARYSRAPAASTAIALLTCFSVAAGSNALFLQPTHHPSPMFGAPQITQTGAVPAPSLTGAPHPVIAAPASTPAPMAAPAVLSTPVAVDAEGVPVEPVGNQQVFAVQKKLMEMGYFDGKVDGYYGPRTAAAIKAFETSRGLRALGALTPDIVSAILSAPVRSSMVETAPVAPVEPLITASVTAVQPMPAELQPATIAPVQAEPLDQMAATAEQALDTVVAGISELNAGRSPIGGSSFATALVPPAAVTGSAPVTETALDPANDQKLVAQVQRALSSLGFLHGSVDGVAGEATAKAIRNFEVYYNYDVTGQVSPGLLKVLIENGAQI